MNNRNWQRSWYSRQQRGKGYIYLLTIGSDTYIGSTQNSLQKRLWQHRTKANWLWPYFEKAGPNYSIICLEEVSEFPLLKIREQYWIDSLTPSINQNRVFRMQRQTKDRIYKGGITYNDKFYGTLFYMWRELGKCSIGTFKSRLHRHPTKIGYALGREPLNLS